MFSKAGLGGLMQQAQKMQENMKKAQAELAQTEVEGQAGNGLVKVVATCSHEVREVRIDPQLIEQAVDDAEMLEDLILAALNDAHQKGEATTSERMSKFTQGLPAGMGDFFK
ncbi:YbaB/EbfC family nucleoid-associated protein [Kingella negevensis]|uniref:Nucleoid-associated protein KEBURONENSIS_01100 n=1 Tax=Kingella negevensis TaxID=1522312 RepID=A0A238HG55_9NEIS|nr:YbaB/EbfC family nucleoid-associated protein [Kingella negevensis]MDK4680110.1 YbaB/EbfC family nucleoid-associated protein [Kingella negevensis]MDK4682170.1 YbaB/EbfC family nucleoid-associated protein [Kingella negevensis]MDK4685045.1 YbaB/EbfC family nucleoid-associated protein [Kingella negevensis]MDK4689631.1 YbaB/EbfC family nucleoid-associated protein [Kingella negevensis]MDK4690367.1 YbaB/EbfC family nucleoid-associated protein [Kingella negevensis]